MDQEAQLSIQMLLSNVLIRLTVLENLLKEKSVIDGEELEEKVKVMTELLVKSIEENISKLETKENIVDAVVDPPV